MAIIQDASTGRTAVVDDENRLKTFAVSQLEDKHANIEGTYWSLYFQVTPVNANSKFFYLQNTGTDDLSITDIRISSTVATNMFLDVVSGTPTFVTGTEADIVNRNLGSSKVPALIGTYDTNITGLVDDGVLLFQECDTANRLYHFKSSSTIIIPQGQAIALQRVAATGTVTVLVSVRKASS